MEIRFFTKIEQDSVKSWLWIFPSLSYIEFYTIRGIYIRGIYFSWLKWDIIAIEWTTKP